MNSKLNGGAEIVCTNSIRLLLARGHAVAWLTIGGPEDTASDGCQIYSLPELPNGNSFRRFRQLATGHFYNRDSVRLAERAIQEFQPDVVHVHTIVGYRTLSAAVLLPFKAQGIPVVQTLHDFGLICPASFFLSSNKVCEACKGKRYYYCAAKKCRKQSGLWSLAAALNAYLVDYVYRYDDLIKLYIAPSNFLRAKFVEFGYSAEKILVVPNAYFPSDHSRAARNSDRRSFILYAGRLSHEKGVDILIKAAKGLDVGVKIAGDGPERDALQRLAQSIRANNIEFLGKQTHTAMNELYRGALLTVVPSRCYENCPQVVLESFSNSTAVVATRIGGMPELVTESETGYLFSLNDHEELSGILRRALKKPAHLRSMGHNASRRAKASFSEDIYAGKLEKALQLAWSGIS